MAHQPGSTRYLLLLSAALVPCQLALPERLKPTNGFHRVCSLSYATAHVNSHAPGGVATSLSLAHPLTTCAVFALPRAHHEEVPRVVPQNDRTYLEAERNTVGRAKGLEGQPGESERFGGLVVVATVCLGTVIRDPVGPHPALNKSLLKLGRNVPFTVWGPGQHRLRATLTPLLKRRRFEGQWSSDRVSAPSPC
jgi:hypothetical protein